MPLLPIAHMIPEHLICVAGKLHGLWRTWNELLCPAIVLALCPGEGYFAGIPVPEFDPCLQDFPWACDGLIHHPEEQLLSQGNLGRCAYCTALIDHNLF